MGKKGSWFSAIKRVFTHNSKNKPTNGSSDKKGIKEKKKGRPEKSKSLIPLFREPSSIEKILGEADQLLIRPTTPNIATNTTTNNNNTIVPNTAITGESSSSSSPPVLPKRQVSVRGLSPKATSPPPLKVSTSGVSCPSSSTSSSKESATKAKTEKRKEIRNVPRVEPTSRDLNLSATKIQAAFRGYVARRSLRALRGLVRLQEVVRGQNVKRQTANAMKQLQLLVRVQTQIQSRRIQTLENRSQDYGNHTKCENEDWDHSSLTKEEVESRMQKKVEAVIRRERAMAYAYSRQLWKENPKSTKSPLDTRSNGQPWWWNWLDRQPPESDRTQSRPSPRNIPQAPSPRGPAPERKPSPLHPRMNFTPEPHQSHTPRSSRSAAIGPAMARRSFPIKDDDSLMSCPPFSVPRYMSPTVSAMAKAKVSGSPRERFMGTPDSRSSRRFSFPLTPKANGALGWDKTGPAGNPGCRSELAGSVGGFGMGSPISATTVTGRKPFNRFV